MKIVFYIVAAVLMSTTGVGGMEVAQKLIKGFFGPETIFEAACDGDVEALEEFLGHVNINSKNKQGMTSLHIAALKGKLSAVQFLLQKGAFINDKDNDLLTPLHRAACRGHLPVVQVLIKNKALINCQNKNLFTPLHLACHQGHTDVVTYLIEQGADINIQDYSGAVPLFYANLKNHVPITQLLEKTSRETEKK